MSVSKSMGVIRHVIETVIQNSVGRWSFVHYSLLFYQSPEDFAARTDPRKREAFWGAFFPYMKALKEAGVVVAGAGLEPPGLATTLRREGEYLISSRRQWEGQLQPKLSERPEN